MKTGTAFLTFHIVLLFIILNLFSYAAAQVIGKAAGPFYELKNGDKREYIITAKFNTSRVQEIVKDTLLANGLTYKQIRWKDPSNTSAGTPIFEYQRTDTSGKVYIFHGEQDKLFYDFSKAAGESYPAPFSDHTWKVIKKYQTTLFGQNLAAVDLELFSKSTGLVRKETVAEKAGLLSFDGESPLHPGFRNGKFWGGIINNERYGDLLAIDNKFAWESFYPLNVGDVWIYADLYYAPNTITSIVIVLKDTLLSDGKIYKKKSVQNSDHYRYERIDSTGKVHIFDISRGSFGTAYQFSACIGDTFSNFLNVKYKIENKFFQYDSLIRQNKYILSLNSINTLNVHHPSFTQDLGMTRAFYEFAFEGLRGAIVKGAAYGDTNRVTSVNDGEGKIIGFSLEQNYPNPFNPVTSISFSLPEASFVTFKVYDILGNEIRTLVSEPKPAGRHSIRFNAAGLSSGIYVYALRAGSRSSHRKAVLLK